MNERGASVMLLYLPSRATPTTSSVRLPRRMRPPMGSRPGEIPLDQRFVDDDDVRPVGCIAIGEFAPRDEGDAHRLQVVGADAVVVDRDLLVRRRRVAVDARAHVAVAAESERHAWSRHSRPRRQAAPSLSRAGRGRTRVRAAHRIRQAAGRSRPAGRCVSRSPGRAPVRSAACGETAGRDQQHERQRDLRDHQCLTDTRPSRRGRQLTGGFLQRRTDGRHRSLQRRHQPEASDAGAGDDQRRRASDRDDRSSDSFRSAAARAG